MTKCIVILTIILFNLPSTVFSEVYRWEDKNGSIHFTDNPSFLPENAKIIEGEKTTKQIQNMPNQAISIPPTKYIPTKTFTPKQQQKPIYPQTSSPMIKPQAVKWAPIIISKTLKILLPILIIIGFISIVLNKLGKHPKRPEQDDSQQNTIPEHSRKQGKLVIYRDETPYGKREALLTKPEQDFLKILETVLQNKYLISHQVAINRMIKTDNYDYNDPMWQRSIDFVLSNKQNGSLLLAIELDDSTHYKENRKKRDENVNKALTEAGINVLRIKRQNSYDTKELKEILKKNYPKEFFNIERV